jgi:hypothetical protein
LVTHFDFKPFVANHVLHSAQFVAAREDVFFHPARRADFLVGQAVSPVIAGWSRHFGCGSAAMWGSQSWLQPPFRRLCFRTPLQTPTARYLGGLI